MSSLEQSSQEQAFSNLSDDFVYSRTQTAGALGISVDTLDRLGCKGPQRIPLSRRRVGYRGAAIKAWLRSREQQQVA